MSGNVAGNSEAGRPRKEIVKGALEQLQSTVLSARDLASDANEQLAVLLTSKDEADRVKCGQEMADLLSCCIDDVIEAFKTLRLLVKELGNRRGR
ncbi:uncharacterized protein J4E92_008830 [Alternaria infectoria]|uniref:uncharacterized protein n=1 Tax=Alternaria infectoria TaxID=45303 RepID=UPI00221E8B5D|nr:uncharacterized protein J4E92_008830 [Alternaria infectoria]KAI4917893.1 hypothetical protein J4E92_008830 [Alternaria infectoria]